MSPTFFPTPAAFRRWLKQHHDSARELWVGFYKKGSGRRSITWPESVDEALCFGWIDGVRKALDGESYVIRFTPRKSSSGWSTVNIGRAKELIRTGRMQPAGRRAFDARDMEKSARYSFEQRTAARLGPEAEATFKKNKAAWEFFNAQPPGYRKVVTWWVVSAKREETRSRRLETLVNDSAAGRRTGLFRRE
ncbi:MAG TPA: YdeI/OmpD-associated family protein [Vicinamibacterales bacterium]|nr:YdeI/OmpD-associated family protein [Vicinamibacterales bacterium]